MNIKPEDFQSDDDYIKAVLLDLHDRVGIVEVLRLLAKISEENVDYWEEYMNEPKNNNDDQMSAVQKIKDFWTLVDLKLRKVSDDLEKLK